MFRQERFNILNLCLYLTIDIISLIFSFVTPYIIRWNILFNIKIVPKSYLVGGLFLPTFEQYSRLYIFWGLIAIFFLHNQNLYKTNRLLSIGQEFRLVLKAALYSALVAGLVVFFIKAINISRLVFIGNFIFVCITLSSWRIIKRLILRRFILKGYNNFNILIVGTGKIAKDTIEEIQKNPYLGLKIVGFLDNKKKEGTLVHGYKVLGKSTDFDHIVHQYFVDEMLITDQVEKELLVQLIDMAKKLNVGIRVIPDPFELSMKVLNIYRIGHLPILDYSIKELHGADLFGKRILDVIVSVFGLIILSPLFLIISTIIKLSDGGPVFYISKRYGKKAEPFNLYKFRSMIVNADSMLVDLEDKNEMDGPIFKIKDDPRVSKFGKFLRKFSIDELPQLWNILKGDMSVVGPRPLPLGQVEDHDLNQLKRLIIKPGMTGLWQIRGRSDISFHQLVKWDNWYINNWSLFLDLYIIFKTIPVVLKGKGAY